MRSRRWGWGLALSWSVLVLWLPATRLGAGSDDRADGDHFERSELR